MKKTVLFLSVLFLAVQSFAANPVGNDHILNAMYDMPRIGCTNFVGGAIDETAKLQAVYSKFNNVNPASLRDSSYTIYFPGTLYKINEKVNGEGYVKIVGDEGKTFFYYDIATTIGESEPMILFIGKSKIYMNGIGFLGSHDKLIGAYVQCNSSPNPNDSLTFSHCYFGDGAVQNALNFGAAGNDADYAYYNDHVLVEWSQFKHIWTTGYRTILDDLTGSFYKYNNRGIHLQQTTLRAKVLHCDFEDISSDGICGKGSTLAMKTHRKMGRYYANWEFAYLNGWRCFMMIELNGNRRGSKVSIHDCNFSNSTRRGGYLISCNLSDKLKIQNNNLENDNRGLIEYSGNNCIISGNIGDITSELDTTVGTATSPMDPGSNRIHFIEANGCDNLMTENIFTCTRKNPAPNAPAEFNGIAINGMTTSPEYGDTVYNGSKIPTGNRISNNIISGCTHRCIDVTIALASNLVIEHNTFNMDTMVASPIEIWGPNWMVKMNTFNMGGNPAPGSNKVIRVRTVNGQTNYSGAQVYYNITFNAAWGYDTRFTNCGNTVKPAL